MVQRLSHIKEIAEPPDMLVDILLLRSPISLKLLEDGRRSSRLTPSMRWVISRSTKSVRPPRSPDDG